MARTRHDNPQLERIRAHAFDTLESHERQMVNLSMGLRLLERGEVVGPRHEGIKAPSRSFLVFADHHPQANFTHDCRYLFYDAETAAFIRESPAKFPPVTEKTPLHLEPFHQPVGLIAEPVVYRPRPILTIPALVERRRYAILWSGMTNKRHLNDMEFLYRTLIDRYAFDPADIYAMSFDGTLNTQDGVQATWPGDGTPYRIQVTGPGNRADFEAAVDELEHRIDRDDLLLIHVNNHGDWDNTPGSANFCTWPAWGKYYATDFAAELGRLPRFSKLIAMLEPCHAGGFNAPILAHSTADASSVASAATEPNFSYISSDWNWDPFARDWIAAQAGHDCFGAPLAFNADADADGRIEAEEAFGYANAVRDLRDTPNYGESSEVGGDVVLGHQFSIWSIWSEILEELLDEPFRELSAADFHERARTLEPELARLAAIADARSAELRAELEPLLAGAVAQAFGAKRARRAVAVAARS